MKLNTRSNTKYEIPHENKSKEPQPPPKQINKLVNSASGAKPHPKKHLGRPSYKLLALA